MVFKLQKISRVLTEFEQNHCDICGESITNPICPDCITLEVIEWIKIYPTLNRKIFPKLKKYLINLENFGNSISCIKCKKAQSVCPYCFTDFVLGQLKKVTKDNKFIDEFNELFDFDNQIPSPYLAKWTPIPRL